MVLHFAAQMQSIDGPGRVRRFAAGAVIAPTAFADVAVDVSHLIL